MINATTMIYRPGSFVASYKWLDYKRTIDCTITIAMKDACCICTPDNFVNFVQY